MFVCTKTLWDKHHYDYSQYHVPFINNLLAMLRFSLTQLWLK